MADIAFNWSEMEVDLSDPKYPRNYLHANFADFSQLKERKPENIWIFRLFEKKYWLIGRLSVDLDSDKPKQASKKHWIKFVPSKSELFIPAIEAPSTPDSVLDKISKQMFRNNGLKNNGQGSSAALKIENPEVIELKKIAKNASGTSLNNIEIEHLHGKPFKTGTKRRENKKPTQPISNDVNENKSIASVSLEYAQSPTKDEQDLIEQILNRKKISPTSDELTRQKQAENGALGEELAIKFEEARLRNESCPEPHKYIHHVAKENVGLGFDIYTNWGRPRCIEVKTSQEGSQNFYISVNEVETLTKLKEHAWIYFVDLSCLNDIEKCVRTLNNPGEKFNKEINLTPTQFSANW